LTSSFYLDRDTVVHRLHPLSKVAAAAGFFVAAFVLERPIVLWPFPAFLLIVAWLAHATPNLWRLRFLLLGLPLGALTIWSLFYPAGEPIFAAGPLRISRDGMLFGLGMALRLATFLLLNVVVLSTTRVEELTAALTRLGLPYRVGFTLTLAFRLVPVFAVAAGTVLQAQRLRSLEDEPPGRFARLRRAAPVLIPVFMGALRRADQMAVALEMRGFALPGRRGGILQFNFAWRDVLALAVALAAPLAAIALRVAGFGLVGR
jgi:energy-coupling factor transport system permease protein